MSQADALSPSEHAKDAVQFSLNGGIDDGRHGLYAIVKVPLCALSAIRAEKKEIPTGLAIEAIKEVLTEAKAIARFDHNELLELIKHLQTAPDANALDVSLIEFQCLKLLDRFSGASPYFS